MKGKRTGLLQGLYRGAARGGMTIRRRTIMMLADSFFRTLSVAGRLHPRADPRQHGVEVLGDIPYAADGLSEHRLDIYRPRPDAGPARQLPVLLYIHGGGFRVLSKDSHWLFGLAFARRGYVVFNINYRLAPRHPFPAALEDACTAYCWLVANAAAYGGDPRRLVLAGESAGANLVTALTLAACYQRVEPCARRVWESTIVPRAVLPACGMLEVSDPGRFARRRRIPTWVQDHLCEVSEVYLGRAPAGPGARDLADPLVVLERGDLPRRPLPPFFVSVGTRDPLLDDSRRLKAALDRLGVPCEAHYYPGEMHAFHALVWRPNARRLWRDTYAFLDRHLA